MAQDLYLLHTPREEEGRCARAAQSWHLDSLKRFAVAALVLRGGHATEFPRGPYSDFSAGVDAARLEGWMHFWRRDGFASDPGREAESVEEHEHFGFLQLGADHGRDALDAIPPIRRRRRCFVRNRR